jgi:hypothetical protein
MPLLAIEEDVLERSSASNDVDGQPTCPFLGTLEHSVERGMCSEEHWGRVKGHDGLDHCDERRSSCNAGMYIVGRNEQERQH